MIKNHFVAEATFNILNHYGIRGNDDDDDDDDDELFLYG